MEPTGGDSNLIQWIVGLMSAAVTIITGWCGMQQVQINSLRRRDDELREVVDAAIDRSMAPFRDDIKQRHTSNEANFMEVRRRLDQLADAIRNNRNIRSGS